MIKELTWLIAASLVGLSLLQLATNTRFEAKVCAITPVVKLA